MFCCCRNNFGWLDLHVSVISYVQGKQNLLMFLLFYAYEEVIVRFDFKVLLFYQFCVHNIRHNVMYVCVLLTC